MNRVAVIFALVIFAACAGAPEKKSAEEKSSILDSLEMKADLGKTLERRYGGELPAADCPGIIYDLKLYNQEYSGDGVFELSMIYLEAENGKDMTFDQSGRWYTLRGDATNPNATVYQLQSFGSKYMTNFLYLTDSLIMLNNEFEIPRSDLNYTLRKM